jgi:hypothetical protein
MKRIATLARIVALAAIATAIPACENGWNRHQTFNIAWFVDPIFGDDFRNDGSPQFPMKTIRRAMQFSISGDEIVLATGTYSPSTGEVFPILVKPGVLILGDPASSGTTTAILGSGSYTIQGGTLAGQAVAAALVLGNGAEISGVKVTAPGATGVGVVCDGNSPLITSSTITGCGASGIRTYQGAAPTITSTTITLNTLTGVTTFDTSAPVFRSCVITSNGADGVLAEDTSAPNLGDATTAGANTITGNTGVGLNNDTAASIIEAIGNTWNVTQGADPSGHYTSAASTTGPIGPPAAGDNFAITNGPPAAIDF